MRRSTTRSDRRPHWQSLVVILTSLAVLSVYLFVSAPAPLEARPQPTPKVPIRTVFAMLELENDAARSLWTDEIVSHGITRGLKFDETWRDERVEAGPLPALFLRETARNLERSSRLGLFLGSRFPINAANQLTGQQANYFEQLHTTGAPQFFYESRTGLQTAMFPDHAVVDACVRCHNEHPDSQKHDWQPNEIMGATTWMYPESAVTTERAVEMVAMLRTSVRAAYAAYLVKVATFTRRPAIGDRWPKDGFFLPSEDAFMQELARRTSAATLQGLVEPGWAETAAARAPVLPSKPIAKATAVEPPKLPTLVIRGVRATRVVVEHAGAKVLVARIPAGGVTSLVSSPPLRVLIADPGGVTIEYAGKPVEVPPPFEEHGDAEVLLDTSTVIGKL
jgi:adenylate cyclase